MKSFRPLFACLLLLHYVCLGESQESKPAQPAGVTRWAMANKRKIDSAIWDWSRAKVNDAKEAEALSPETEAKVRQYEQLQSEMSRKQMEVHMRSLPRPGVPPAPSSDKDLEELSKRVAEAKLPVTDIIDRRSRLLSTYRGQFTVENLVAEYAKDRFDLVVDSSDEQFSRSSVLYRATGEVLDITDGVIKLLNDKTKKDSQKPQQNPPL
jgi:hypothetical protein